MVKVEGTPVLAGAWKLSEIKLSRPGSSYNIPPRKVMLAKQLSWTNSWMLAENPDRVIWFLCDMMAWQWGKQTDAG